MQLELNFNELATRVYNPIKSAIQQFVSYYYNSYD